MSYLLFIRKSSVQEIEHLYDLFILKLSKSSEHLTVSESHDLENVQSDARFVLVMTLFFSIISTDCCYYVTLQTRGAELLHALPCKIGQSAGGHMELRPQINA